MSNEYSSIPHYLQTEDFYSEVKSRMRLLEASGSILYLATFGAAHLRRKATAVSDKGNTKRWKGHLSFRDAPPVS